MNMRRQRAAGSVLGIIMVGSLLAAGGAQAAPPASAAFGASAASGASAATLSRPRPANDSVLTVRGRAVRVNVLANDSGAPTRVVTVGRSKRGKVRISGNGKTVTFTPRAGFVGTTTFTYRARNARGTSAKARVTVRVLRPSSIHAPLASAVASQKCASRIVLGHSRLGSQIVACQVRGSDSSQRPLLVLGSMHGDEKAGIGIVDRLLRKDLSGRAANIWVIDALNPDGVAASLRTNARGIDLNGNFPTTGWKQRSRDTHLWGGPSAASEPETAALMTAMDRLRPQEVVVFHQALNGIDCPPYRSAALSKRLRTLTGYRYKCLAVNTGNFTAWANTKYAGTSALTFELEARPSAARLDRVAAGLVTLASRPAAQG